MYSYRIMENSLVKIVDIYDGKNPEFMLKEFKLVEEPYVHMLVNGNNVKKNNKFVVKYRCNCGIVSNITLNRFIEKVEKKSQKCFYCTNGIDPFNEVMIDDFNFISTGDFNRIKEKMVSINNRIKSEDLIKYEYVYTFKNGLYYPLLINNGDKSVENISVIKLKCEKCSETFDIKDMCSLFNKYKIFCMKCEKNRKSLLKKL